jgi:ATP synthase, F1 delta subunit
MTGSVAAGRYASALYSLANASGAEVMEKTGADIESFAALARESAALSELFRNPAFSAEEKQQVITALADKLEAGTIVRNFLFLLADKHRLALLDAIAGEYQTLRDAANGILRGEMVSAVPLDEGARKEVLDQLEKKTGKALVLDFRVDEALLGGMVLTVGDNVMDASLKTQLSILKDTIKRGA